MELVSVYNVMPPIECLLAVIAVVFFIAGGIAIFNCIEWRKWSWVQAVVAGVIMVFIGAVILTWNTYHPNQDRYEYFVTDMSQVQQMVDDGWVVVYSEDNIYTFKKGE